MDKSKGRMVAPDILKIAATVFVILIHHKMRDDAVFMNKVYILTAICFVLAVVASVFLYIRETKKQSSPKRRIFMALLPFGIFLSLVYLRKLAVCIFMIMTGYLLSGTVMKYSSPIKEWYKRDNIIPRVSRFYLPFIPIFIIGLLFKIFVLGKEYSVAEVLARFILGGFKPGSYYITAMAELVLIFPLVFVVVKRFKLWGVLFFVCLNFAYDIFAVTVGMNAILYKFLAFRFLAHIAFGVYAKVTDLKSDKRLNIALFIIGFLYMFIYCYANIRSAKLFYEWRVASFPTAFFMYPMIVFFIDKLKNLKYTDSRLSQSTLLFANATYHIFLVQLLYYTTVGYDFNAFVDNVIITMPLNVVICVPLGIMYYKLISPYENKILAYTKKKLK